MLNSNGAPPILILGGEANALSIIRRMAKRGVAVGFSGSPLSPVMRSRHLKLAYPVPQGMTPADFWRATLLEAEQPPLRGAVLFPCSDDGIEFVCNNAAALGARYILDGNDAGQRLGFLNKQRTLEQAQEVGVDTPRFWRVSTIADLSEIRQELRYPVIVKPQLSHVFQKHFGGRRYLKADGWQDLEAALPTALEVGVSVMISEFIDGPDDLACSYYTYITEDGTELFSYTKRVLRRQPKNQGGGTYHVTKWLPEVAEAGRKFFRGVGLRGFGNIEFKRDVRDGKLKVIEVNARFTAAQELISASGLDMPFIVYSHRAGRMLPPIPKGSDLAENALWLPLQDYRAFRDLRKSGELGVREWLRTVVRRQGFPLWSASDPMPALNALWRNEIRTRLPGGRQLREAARSGAALKSPA